MVNTKVLKLNKNSMKGRCEKENNVYKLKREILKLKEQRRKLNISNEIRSKNVSELTECQKDILYNDYIFNSAIEGLNDFLTGRYFTCQNLQEVEELLGGI